MSCTLTARAAESAKEAQARSDCAVKGDVDLSLATKRVQTCTKEIRTISRPMSIPELAVADVSLGFCPTWSTLDSFVPDPKGADKGRYRSSSVDFEYKYPPRFCQNLYHCQIQWALPFAATTSGSRHQLRLHTGCSMSGNGSKKDAHSSKRSLFVIANGAWQAGSSRVCPSAPSPCVSAATVLHDSVNPAASGRRQEGR